MIFSKTERLLAFRYLRSRKRTGFVSVIAGFSFLGIMLGVATLIIVMSVMNGFRSELMERILGLNGPIAIAPEWGDTLAQAEQHQKVIQRLPHVQHVVPIIDAQGMASAHDDSNGVMLRGMTAEDFQQHPLLMEQYQGNRLEGFHGAQLIVGTHLARRMRLHIGDTVTLLSPKGTITAFGTIPKMKAYQVWGTFNSGMYEYDNNLIFMPLTEAQKFFQMGDKISRLEVFVDSLDSVPTVMEAGFNLLGDGVQIYDWRYSNQAFFNAIEIERNVMFLILTLIIIVAAFNMISGLIMLVQDKTKDIAVLRTMGMTRGGIQRIFLLSGLTVGLWGTAAGVGLGLLFSYHIESIRRFLENLSGTELFSAEIYFLSHLPAEVNLTEVFVVGGMSLILALLATIYPSWKAGKTDPVEALRYE